MRTPVWEMLDNKYLWFLPVFKYRPLIKVNHSSFGLHSKKRDHTASTLNINLGNHKVSFSCLQDVVLYVSGNSFTLVVWGFLSGSSHMHINHHPGPLQRDYWTSSILYWCKDRHTNQRNKREMTEINKTETF